MRRIYQPRFMMAFGLIVTLAMPGVAQTAPEAADASPSRAEMSQKLNQMEIDPNSAEARKMRRQRIKFLERADANRDDVLTRDELSASVQKRFDQADRNGDGVFDFGDKPAAAPRARFERAISPMLERLDADGSGGVTFAEFSAQSMQGFDAFDADGTGAVDLPAMIAAIESVGQK